VAVTPVSLYPLAASKVIAGGTPVTAMNGPVGGGLISNPLSAADQGIAVAEQIFVDVTGPAALGETATTFELQPGDTYPIPAGLTSDVSVNAATSGHRFSGVIFQPPTQFPPTPQSGTFPPSAPTTLTQTIPSYIYQQFADDADLQAFAQSFNLLAQIYVSWFATVPLAVYTSPAITGALLDWVARGIYGFVRPSLASGRNRNLGSYNTTSYNTIAYNRRKVIGPSNVTVTSDDVFKRIITWNFYKGDGNVFNVRWLKRRIMRFLLGTNGTAPNIDQTYLVSVGTGPGIISIRMTAGTRTILTGPYNTRSYNTGAYNSVVSRFNPSPTHLPFEDVLQEAIQSGVLQFPFQLAVTIQI
jgi:hypothetical protein